MKIKVGDHAIRRSSVLVGRLGASRYGPSAGPVSASIGYLRRRSPFASGGRSYRHFSPPKSCGPRSTHAGAAPPNHRRAPISTTPAVRIASSKRTDARAIGALSWLCSMNSTGGRRPAAWMLALSQEAAPSAGRRRSDRTRHARDAAGTARQPQQAVNDVALIDRRLKAPSRPPQPGARRLPQTTPIAVVSIFQPRSSHRSPASFRRTRLIERERVPVLRRDRRIVARVAMLHTNRSQCSASSSGSRASCAAPPA
jgi:hypothetical protein